MAECLARPEAEHAEAIAAACQRWPEHARALQSRIDRLRAFGLAEEVAPGPGDMPARLGEFRLLRRLGGGGMGVVYAAIQEPLGREVALKLIRPEHLFFSGARERFRREVETIGSLQHAGIVPIYTVGEHMGVPYYAMELVHGRSLAEVVTAQHGKQPERLDGAALGHPAMSWVDACCEIVRQVAEALHHAHLRGVVHRDVKPSNVVMTADGQARLIDFGLATRSGAHRLTKSGSTIGSLAYMAPEQLRGEEVGAKADIYSLGVLLYELVTLRPPFWAEGEASLRQRILDAVPVSPRALNRRATWDVETICAVAMAPEPARRYRSAEALAEDLALALARQPIRARRPGPLLRASRFVQRRPGLTASFLLGLTLVVVLPLTLVLQAQGAAARIAREAENRQRVAQFVLDLFAEADPNTSNGGDTPVRTFLGDGVARVRAEVGLDPETRAGFLATMGRVYHNLGLFRDAEPLLREALEAARKAWPPDDLRVLERESWHGTALHMAGEDEQAGALLAVLIPKLRALEGREAQDVLIGALRAYGRVLTQIGDRKAGRLALEESLDLARHQQPPARSAVEASLSVLAQHLRDYVHPLESLPLARELQRLVSAEETVHHPRRIQSMLQLAETLMDLGQMAETKQLLDEAFAAVRSRTDTPPVVLARLLDLHAGFLLEGDQELEADAEIEKAIATYSTMFVADHPSVARIWNQRGLVRMRRGDGRSGTESFGKALAIYEKRFPRGHPHFAIVLANAARAHLHSGDNAAAIRDGRRALAMFERLAPGLKRSIGTVQCTLGLALTIEGELAEGRRLVLAGEKQLREWLAADHRLVARAWMDCAHALLLQNAGKEALPYARDALAMLERITARPDYQLAEAQFCLGWAEHTLGRLDVAAGLQLDSIAGMRAVLSARHPMLAFPMNDLAVIRAKQGRFDEAEPLFVEALQIRRDVYGERHDGLALSWLNMASMHERRGRRAEAVAAVLASLTATRGSANRQDPKRQMACTFGLHLLTTPPEIPSRPELLEQLQQLADELLPPDARIRADLAKARIAAASRPGTASRAGR